MKIFKGIGKKGQRAFTLNDMSSIAISLVVVAIVIGIGSTILTQVQSTADSSVNTSDPSTWNVGYNVSNDGLTGLNTLASYIPTIALVAVAAIVIGIILVFFARNR